MESAFSKWANGLDHNAVDLWRESLAQLRQLHGDVWNGVRFFWTVNGIFIAAAFTVLSKNKTSFPSVSLSVLCLITSTLLTAVGLYILRKHRKYYISMLLKKTLIEIELGFTKHALSPGVNAAFPWVVETKYHEEMLRDPGDWLKKQVFRPGTISDKLRIVYVSMIAIDAVLIVAIAVMYISGVIHGGTPIP